MNYLQFEFETESTEKSDQLVALLHESGFEGFEEGEKILKAFIAENNFSKVEFQKTIKLFPSIHYTIKTVENINWNQQWEEGFEPVVVNDFVSVRAHFHSANNMIKYDIIITPKMSFGTGHHATTWLMLSQMQHFNFVAKNVLDFGTGTGVLAILAEKLGAKNVVALDNDEWSITNAKENIIQNNCEKINVTQTDIIPLYEKFDIILANINLNVIISALSSIALVSRPGADILLSGFLKENEQVILSALYNAGLQYISITERDNWIIMHAQNPI